MRLLDEEAPLIAAEEEERAESATSGDLSGDEDDDGEAEEFEGDLEELDAE
jgi:hypothetical protein